LLNGPDLTLLNGPDLTCSPTALIGRDLSYHGDSSVRGGLMAAAQRTAATQCSQASCATYSHASQRASVRRRPRTAERFGTAFNRAKTVTGMHDRNLHVHDLRETAVTKLIRRKDRPAYVERSAATKALIRQLNEKR
jgi:hypothetical protein